jgi:hypothetical protein
MRTEWPLTPVMNRDRIDALGMASVPRLMNERETANLLRVKSATVRAERIKGLLGYTRVGARIFYTYLQIADYLERQSVAPCDRTTSSAQDKSVGTGLARSRDMIERRSHGAELGTTIKLDRRAVSALARQTFMRRASVSRPGSSPTNEAIVQPRNRSSLKPSS